MYRHGIGGSAAGEWCLEEDITLWDAEQGIKRRNGREHILVEDPDTAAYRGLALAGRIPGKTQLWRSIKIQPKAVAKALRDGIIS